MKAKKPLADRHRKAELAKIHIAKKDLGLDDDTYRAMLQQVGGVASSKDLTALGRAKVLEHLKSHGFDSKKHIPKKPNNLSRSKQMGKIEALLADAGRPWAYAIGMARHMYKKDRLEFCGGDELRGIIAALAKDQKKRSQAGASPPLS
jgi:phage gp16-like protein